MKLTLTYQGPLPPKQRGVSPVKAVLRAAFHPQIKAQIAPRIVHGAAPNMTSAVNGHAFLSPSHATFQTAVELDVLLLAPHSIRAGDVDNRLKTLIDGLTRPANQQQLDGHVDPSDGGPTYCLTDDDGLVKRIGLDSRRWYQPTLGENDALVVVTATIVLGDNFEAGSSFANAIFVV